MSKVRDYEYTIECGSFTLEVISAEFDGISVLLYFGNGHSMEIKIYDELTEKFKPEYATLCMVLDPFIVEQLENQIKLCFLKY